MQACTRSRTRQFHRSFLLVLLASLLWTLLAMTQATAHEGVVFAQQDADRVLLEALRPAVEWRPQSEADWQDVPRRQWVQVGDQVRTGPQARARLTYSDGTFTDLAPGITVRVQ